MLLRAEQVNLQSQDGEGKTALMWYLPLSLYFLSLIRIIITIFSDSLLFCSPPCLSVSVCLFVSNDLSVSVWLCSSVCLFLPLFLYSLSLMYDNIYMLNACSAFAARCADVCVLHQGARTGYATCRRPAIAGRSGRPPHTVRRRLT